MKRIFLTFLFILISLPFVFSSGNKEKTYVFASNATWPPFEYVDENGDLVGFEIDLVNEIASLKGIKVEIRNAAWDTIFAGLINGQYDAIASGVTVTEERKQAMDFSTPFCNAGQILIVRQSDASRIKGINDVPAGSKIGTQMGTTGDFLVADNYPSLQDVGYDYIGLAIEDLINGNLIGVLTDSPIASDYVLANPNYANRLVTVGDVLTAEDLAFVVRKGDTELLPILNEGLAELEANGKLQELKDKWNIL